MISLDEMVIDEMGPTTILFLVDYNQFKRS